MLCARGLCIKCPTIIMEGSGPSSKYQEIVCMMSDNSLMAIGICNQCFIDDEDIPELTLALRETFGIQGFNMKADVIEIVQRKTLGDVLKEIQANRCSICFETIGDNYAITNGRLIHDVCKGARGKISETPANVALEPVNARERRKHPIENKYGKRI